jgi:hypothetical protein
MGCRFSKLAATIAPHWSRILAAWKYRTYFVPAVHGNQWREERCMGFPDIPLNCYTTSQ